MSYPPRPKTSHLFPSRMHIEPWSMPERSFRYQFLGPGFQYRCGFAVFLGLWKPLKPPLYDRRLQVKRRRDARLL